MGNEDGHQCDGIRGVTLQLGKSSLDSVLPNSFFLATIHEKWDECDSLQALAACKPPHQFSPKSEMGCNTLERVWGRFKHPRIAACAALVWETSSHPPQIGTQFTSYLHETSFRVEPMPNVILTDLKLHLGQWVPNEPLPSLSLLGGNNSPLEEAAHNLPQKE